MKKGIKDKRTKGKGKEKEREMIGMKKGKN